MSDVEAPLNPVRKAIQCKNIADAPLLDFVAHKQAEKGYWVNTWDFLGTPYEALPDKLLRAKMGMLIRRGLVDGCNCGCRGDYEMTDKGRDYLRDYIG